MQGKLQEIDIRSIFKLLELEHQTGELFVETSASRHWFVFFIDGRIAYATEAEDSIVRLRDYLQRFEADTVLDRVQPSPNVTSHLTEYARLWGLLEHHKLTSEQGQQILLGMSREVMFDLLSITEGSFIFESNPPLTPHLSTFPTTSLVKETEARLQAWEEMSGYLKSPDQSFTLTDPESLKQSLPPASFESFTKWSGGMSLRQIGRYLGRDVVAVSKAMYPYVERGTICLSDAPENQKRSPSSTSNTCPHVVCIDDSMAIQKTVEYILQGAGYQVTTIGNPLKALGQVFLLKPDILLCDVAMPKLDGYELCGMLRKASTFAQVPIVMLTGKDGFTDRIKARMAGANEFLTKPFGEKELLTTIEQFAGKPLQPNQSADVAAPIS